MLYNTLSLIWSTGSSSASKSIILYWDTTILPRIDLEIILGKSTFCKPTWETLSRNIQFGEKNFCAGWEINHNPPCVTLLHLILDFVNDHLSKTCQLSGLTLLVGFQMMFWFCAYNGDYAGHIPLPPRYWIHDLSLSENTVLSSLLPSLGDLTLLKFLNAAILCISFKYIT